MTDELEDRVRGMLQRRAVDVTPSPDAWDAIEQKAAATGRRGGQRWLAVAAAVAVVAGVAVAVVATRPEQDTSVVAGPGSTTSTTARTGGASADPAYEVPAVWPATTSGELAAAARAAAAGDRQELRDPSTAATAYLEERFGLRSTHLETEYLEGDARSGEVRFTTRPRASSGGLIKGVVFVRQIGDPAIWVVYGSSTDLLDIHQLMYDGERLTGEMNATTGGRLDTTVEAVDTSGRVERNDVRVQRTGSTSIDHRIAGARGVVVRLVLRFPDSGMVGFAEARADVPTVHDDEGAGPVEQCSAIGADIDIEAQPQLPAEVDAIRTKLVELARRCDFDALEEVALSGGAGSGFTFTYGAGEQGPAGYWRDREAEGEPVMRRLLEVLSLRPTRQDPPSGSAEGQGPPVQWVWPAVSGTDRPTDQDWDDLRRYHSDEEVDQARDQLGAWYGYRIGITLDGDWIYFVAGD